MLRLPLLSLLLAVTSGCDFGGKHRSVGKVGAAIADAKTLVKLAIDNTAGTIEVREAKAADDARIEVEVLLIENRPESDFAPKIAEHVTVARDGSTLSLGNAHAGASDRNDWQLRFVVHVPSGVAIDIDQVVGAIDVALPSSRAVDVVNVTGSTAIAIPRVDGKLRAKVTTGSLDIRTESAVATGGYELGCVTGSIELRLPEEAHGAFDLSAITGEVDIDERFGLVAKRKITQATCKGEVGNGGPEVRAKVVTGQIVVR